MKKYNTTKEVEEDIINGKLIIDDDITFFSQVGFFGYIDIECKNLRAYCPLKVGHIKADNIHTNDLKCWNIKADKLTCSCLYADNIDITDMLAFDIVKANSINARDIKYHNVLYVIGDLKYRSIKGATIGSRHFSQCGNEEKNKKYNLLEKIKKYLMINL